MKKWFYVISLMLVLFNVEVSHAALDSVGVIALKPGLQMWDTATKSVKIPAYVEAVKGAVKAAKWLPINILPAVGGKILKRLVAGGGVLGAVSIGSDIMGYLYDKAYDYIQGELKKSVQTFVPPAGRGACHTFVGGTCTTIGFYGSQALAQAAAVAAAVGGEYATGDQAGGPYSPGNVYFYGYRAYFAGQWRTYEAYYGGTPTYSTSYVTPTFADLSTLETTITNDLNNAAPLAIAALKQAVQKTSDAIDYPGSDPLAVGAPAVVTGLKQDIGEAVSNDNKTVLETATDSPTADDTWANQTEKAKADVAKIPAYVPATATLNTFVPTVGDFSGLFTSFIASMKATSLFSLPGALYNGIPTSSECTMTVEMAENYGGTQTVSFCGWTWLTILRGVLMLIGTYIAIRIVMVSGG